MCGYRFVSQFFLSVVSGHCVGIGVFLGNGK